MKTKLLVSVIMSAVLLLVPCAFTQGVTKDCERDSLCVFQTRLNQDGFDMTPGIAEAWNPVELWCSGDESMPNALWCNTGRYVVLKVPKEVPKPREDPALISDFKLRQDEAIVLFGSTPPPVKYFGFYTFISTRFYPDREQGKERARIGSTVGDAVNMATIKTTGPTPYDRPFALIITPNQSTDASVRRALKRAGYHEGGINTYALPASMLNLGDGPYADEFRVTLRTAWFDDPIAGEAYINNAQTDLHMFRVTPRATADPNPFPVPPLRVRGTGETEMRLMNKLGELRQSIIDAHPELQATDHPTIVTSYEDNDGLQQQAWLEGGTRDGLNLSAGWMPDWSSRDPITLEDDEFLMVYGVNHASTGKTTYMNVSVYATGRDVGEPEPENGGNVVVGSVFDNALSGTAAGYLPAGDPDAKLMYAYKVSRNCAKGEPNCLPLSAPCARLTLDSKTVLGFFIRMYLEPATRVGAAMGEILYDRVIKFSPRP